MDKDGDKKGDKKGSSSSVSAADQASLLDAASLFAYWGRDPSAMAAAAASNPLFGSHFGAGLGGLMQNAAAAGANDRFSMSHPHHNTMAVAASQAASLAGLHSASWWAQLAAQDYFARLQASGMSQLPFTHPDLAAAFPGGLSGLPGVGGSGAGVGGTGSSGSSGKNNMSNSKSNSNKKRERSSNSTSSNASSGSGLISSANHNNNHANYKNSSSPATSSPAPSSSSYKQNLYSQATLQKELMAITAAKQQQQHHKQQGSSSSHHSSSNNQRSSQSPSVNKSSPSVTISASNSSSHHSQHNSHQGSSSRTSIHHKNHQQSSNSSASATAAADLGLSASMNALNQLSQFGNLDLATQQNMTATMNALAASSAKAKDYMNSGILNDPSSILGVRLPPDTEIIKYTSSIVGPKVPGTTNRGPKRPRLEATTDYSNLPSAHQSDRIEVIKLPPTITSNGLYNAGKNSGKESSSEAANDWSAGLNLSGKSTTSSTASVGNDSQSDNGGEAPLNLSLKTETKSRDQSSGSSANSLQSLSTITAALGQSGGLDSKARRKSDNKERLSISESSTNNEDMFKSSLSELLKMSNYDDRDFSSLSSSQFKEGRPRNLGRGVSKPKKNTVASLLAQSRAVGSKNLTPQQLLAQEADLENAMRQLAEASQQLDTSNTDSESVAESGMSESEGEEQVNMKELRVPIERGWKRETIIKGLTKNGQIKGDVYYFPPNSQNRMKSINQIQLYLDQFKPKDLTKDNFSFNAKAIVGTFLQPAPPPYATDGEYIKMTDSDVQRRLEELKMFTRHTPLNVEQRIEIAKQQQALRDAKKAAKEELNRNKEKAKQAKEIERNERLEMQRRERELKNQQAQEAKRKRDEELARQKMEEAQRKQQMYLQDLNKQKELLYTVELERERRRQHMALIKQLELRRKYEERERKKNQMVIDKLILREKKLAARKRDAEILAEIRKPQEDSEIPDQQDLPTLPRVPGLKLTGNGYADLLMAFEFLHNFGETLGFDMESLPTLQSLHQALTSENAVEAEEELLSVMTHLLVCAIEDPGIPNPTRHTTLLGQTLKQADITHANVSEILRIYLYAVATGEVRQLSGINLERDPQRSKNADLHSTDPEFCMNSSIGKNCQFYELLHENVRWKLSETLKDKPYVALNPTVKAQILAMLCNDLLLNKAVCKQIDTSLESQAQLKKERYLLDAKIRKFKSLVQRKQRLEQYEKAQALALEKSLSMKTNETNVPNENNNGEEVSPEMNHKEESNGATEENPNKTGSNETFNEVAEITPTTTDIDAPSEKNEEENSDLESEGTNLEEDEDANLTAEEVQKKLDKILEASYQNKQQLEQALGSLRGKCFGQDRHWRRFWSLSKCGGVYVEGMESTQSDVFKYNTILEEMQDNPDFVARTNYRSDSGRKDSNSRDYHSITGDKKKRGRPRIPKKDYIAYDSESADNDSRTSCDEASKPEVQEMVVLTPPPPPPPPPPPQMPLHHSTPQKREENDDLLDIEDSIPTAILVQKSNNINETRIVEINNQIGVPTHMLPKQEPEMQPEAVKQEQQPLGGNEANGDCDMKPKIENGEAPGDKDEDSKDVEIIENVKMEEGCVKQEVKMEVEQVSEELKNMMDKWFSICNKDIQLTSTECPTPAMTGTTIASMAKLLYTNATCKEIIQAQGNRWDISNNIQYFSVPIDKGAEMKFDSESILTTSGLSEYEMYEVAAKKMKKEEEPQDFSDVKPVIKAENQSEETSSFTLPAYMNLTLNNLSAFVQCDNMQPLQMSAEEQKLLEEIKINGVPRKSEKAAVAKDLRFGWWKINDIEELNEFIKALDIRGIREKNLRQNLLQSLSESVYLTTPHHVSNPRAPPPPHGYIEPEAFNVWNPQISRRVELALLDQIEAFEDKIASASMQMKGWQIPQREGDSENGMDDISIDILRERILGLEAAIERRYLKPPLGIKYTAEAQIAAIQQQEAHQKEKEKEKEQDLDCSSSTKDDEEENLPKGLMSWRDAVERSNTTAQLSMALYVLESCVAWDKSIMKANCQFCQSGESEDKLLLCDGCDRGYHTYCFKPRMDKIPEGDWYCYECKNKATGDRKCIVCGGHRAAPYGKMIYCELCPRAYHQDCYIPPMLKTPRGKWYCQNCVSKAPPKKRGQRKPKELKSHNSSQSLNSSHDDAPLSPTPSVASSTFEEHQNATPAAPPAEVINKNINQSNSTNVVNNAVNTNNVDPNDSLKIPTALEATQMNDISMDASSLDISMNSTATSTPIPSRISSPTPPVQNNREEENREEKSEKKDKKDKDEAKERLKQEKKATKKLMKELAVCKTLLEEMEVHEDAWPFLLPVNTKQFPTYKKIIKYPMDLSTIRKRLQDMSYKSRDNFVCDVRQIFDNCEVFNEDDSPVGTAGHGLRKYFEVRWAELTDKHS